MTVKVFRQGKLWPPKSRDRRSAGQAVEATEYTIEVADGADDGTAYSDGVANVWSNSATIYLGRVPQ